MYIAINISHPNLKDVASIKKNFGVLEHNDCADKLQVQIKCFKLNTSTWNLWYLVFCLPNYSDLLWELFFQILGLQPWISKVFLDYYINLLQQWKVKTVIENIFFDLFLDISQVSCIRKIRIHIRNEMGFRNLQKKCLCFDLGILWRGFSARFSNWSQGKQSESNIKE